MENNIFNPDRIFSQRNNKTGLLEWFFSAREGLFGPYDTRDTTVKIVQEFIERHKAIGDDGGRSKAELSLEPLEDNETIKTFDPLKRKKGLDT
jgi:hypothetical protein